MPVKPDEAKTRLIEKVVEHARSKLPAEQAARLESLVRIYYGAVAAEDLLERDAHDLYGAALSLWTFASRRAPGEAKVRVHAPRPEEHGWGSTHTVVEVVNDDMPFLVDSVSMELTRTGRRVHLIVHPVLKVRRDAEGVLLEVLQHDAPADDAVLESFIHAEVDRETGRAQVEEIHAGLERVLADVRAAVDDWQGMRERARTIVADLDEHPPPVDPEELAEARALLEWIVDDHFTFLGYREYDLVEDEGGAALRRVAGTGLGILRDEARPGESLVHLHREAGELARAKELLVLTKANSRATVHRPSHLDYVGVKRFGPAGEVVGEQRFLGLYTSTAYSVGPHDIPVLRRKVRKVRERAGLPPGSHDDKALLEILESYPRDELFQISEDELFETAMGIVRLGERQRVRLFVRRDMFGRFLSCLVFVPRDRFNTQVRARIQEILQEAFDGVGATYAARMSESVLARLHYVVYVEPGRLPDYDVGEIEERIVEASRTWADDLGDELAVQLGEERGTELARLYLDAFPPAYRDDFTPAAAVRDIERMERLDPDGDLALTLYRPLEAEEGFFCLKLLRSGRPILLSDALPLLEDMGVKVYDERPYEVARGDGAPAWIYDFGLTYEDGPIDLDRLGEDFKDAFAEAWRGRIENDGFNRLVLRAGLTWREIAMLRALARYLRQTGTTFSQAYMEETLSTHAGIARQLVELFRLRFDPARAGARERESADLAAEIETGIDGVASLDDDRILRSFLRLVEAVLRTNYFQRDARGRPKPYLAFKLDPGRVPDLPRPRPLYEIWVYSPRTEGVHLRAGRVARGGIRWSDRRVDFRTEILGLMKAQVVKNAVIVPVGAKGGFVVKRPPADPEALREEVLACYGTLIRGLLDVTDNIVGGAAAAPRDVVRYDGDDPYLVVAADKGTATFSDVANGIAAEYGFWLGDAFASGGSAGYDHKRMGITARGAWESVTRHFKELGVDVRTAEITVVGIGDMAGDVFGNGMLLSPHLKLVAAFNHEHVFLDPNPDPRASREERQRLFDLPGSSWADYDPALISAGGGVFPRTAKSIPLSAEVRALLDVQEEALAPSELVRALLAAPVDLLWNGGIGTFVKASWETNAEVGDRANDAVRVDGRDLRARVVGEGGNLGLTQRGRIEYALAGGRVNTDAIDNSAGVDCSDHEVNIKILLGDAVASGDLTEKQRNALLAEMTDDVARLVLRNNYRQTQALSLAATQARSMLGVHARLIAHLEASGRLDRELESLPNEEVMGERRAAGRGLVSPELAVLLAHAKIELFDALLASDLPDDPAMADELARYFPDVLSERFGDRLVGHPLRRELVATYVTNSLVNRAGSTFAFRLAEETGAPAADVARAYSVAREVFELRRLWTSIEALDFEIGADVQLGMLLEGRRLVERATRWLVRNRPRPLDVAGEIQAFAPGAAVLAEALPELLLGSDRQALEEAVRDYARAGVPEELALRVAGLSAMLSALDIVEVAAASGASLRHVAGVYYALGARLELHWLRDEITALPRDNRWQTLARAALRDELYGVHRALTREALEAAPAADPEAAVETWQARNRAGVERTRQVLVDIHMGGLSSLETLSVALREIRNLIQSGARLPEHVAAFPPGAQPEPAPPPPESLRLG
ncbi:MAG TPA: NAD-glutamate dehydrogenase [Gaiellaceae bacterium]|nr:NAD-glutamate dehydrogenase [Gaiellaceae bacterium]